MKQEMGVKDKLNKLWDIIYVNYRSHKMELVESYVKALTVANAYRVLEDQKDYEKFEQLAEDLKESIDKLDTSIKKHGGYGDLFGWISTEFILAVIKMTDIECERVLNKDDNYKDSEYNKAMSIIYIVRELTEDVDEENYYNNIQRIELKDKIIYAIKDVVLFVDSKNPCNINKLYHGTTIFNARDILGMGKLLSKEFDGIDNFYNKDKIFFTESLEASKNYAMRNTSYVHVVFEFDVSGIALYQREHLLVERAGNLYFNVADELNIKDRIIKLYLIEDGQMRETNIDEIMEYKYDYISDEDNKKHIEIQQKFEELYKQNAENKIKYIDIKKQYKELGDSMILLAKVKGITRKEVAKLYDIDDVLYNNIFPVDDTKIFNTLEDHIEYLKNIDIYEELLSSKGRDKDFTFDIVDNTSKFYHGTTLEFAKNIVKENIFKSYEEYTTSLSYNRVFFTTDVGLGKKYALAGSAKRVSKDSKIYIIFECDLKGFSVYNNYGYTEYFVWGNISADVIKHIYLCQGNNILKEITKDELLEI